MSKFTIGGSGTKTPKARDLPEGTKVRVAEIARQQSTYTQEIRNGPNKGQTLPKQQIKVVYERVDDGERFAQYYGGVYLKDPTNPDAGFTVTEKGSAYAFFAALRDAGFPIQEDLDAYKGLVVTIAHIKGHGAQGPYKQALPATLVSRPTATAAPTPTPAAAAPVADASAFGQLPPADQETILEAIKDGTELAAAELVEAGIARDGNHATAILASLPGRKKLTRKA